MERKPPNYSRSSKITLASDQAKVTFVPKMAAELPFFILARRRKQVRDKKGVPEAAIIKIQTTDESGRPIKWEVYHNVAKGIPGEGAHKVDRLLTQPSIDATRSDEGWPAEIVPLGRMRES